MTACFDGRLLTIQTRRYSGIYAVHEIPLSKPWTGRAYELVKLWGGSDSEGTSYTVLLSDRHELADECGCRGSLRWNRCKHRKALRTVLDGR